VRIIGRALVLPRDLRDDVNTDVIIAGQYLRLPEAELAPHAFEAVMPDFPGRAHERPVLVAGANMGCGSSREQAVKALLGCGVRLVLAHSFGQIFQRNAINLGLPPVVLSGAADLIAHDSLVEADLAEGWVRCDGVEVGRVSYPTHIRAILEAGGILPLLKKDPNALVGR